ncbi:MAG: amidohydrolase family protein, partial [Alphaproteobacteria bacterium]
YVDGVQVVRDGRVLTLDHEAALTRMEAERLRAEARVPERDWAGRTGEELSPLTLPVMEA